ncbi:hypothetical protein [uncultured Massilia sp.]|uniref:hypothetical protein n=1 Tax=uncultured Massilia sp. TaxID=169973 RepID=UPI00258AD81E|nr:hypothetical protein [uncultured Massilia sp.]
MTDQANASRLANEAFDLWQAGNLEQARVLYDEAISLADPEHFGLPMYHGQYASLLNYLGQREQATEQMEKALAAEIAQGYEEGSSPTIVARYFLADQLLRLGHLERALDTLAPSIRHAPESWLTRYQEAQVLFAMDRKADARTAAALAVKHAPTADKAEELRERLKEVFGGAG